MVNIEGGTTTWLYEGRGLIYHQYYPNGAQHAWTYDGNRRPVYIGGPDWVQYTYL